jgi:hypothetical protein
MIKFNLKCKNEHRFESWFGSNEDYEKLRAKKLISCMICGSFAVEKAIMAPRLSADTPKPALSDKPPVDDVGTAFPEEARKMHYGDAPKRAIMGEAKLEEAKALLDEGVPVVPMGLKPKLVN